MLGGGAMDTVTRYDRMCWEHVFGFLTGLELAAVEAVCRDYVGHAAHAWQLAGPRRWPHWAKQRQRLAGSARARKAAYVLRHLFERCLLSPDAVGGLVDAQDSVKAWSEAAVVEVPCRSCSYVLRVRPPQASDG